MTGYDFTELAQAAALLIYMWEVPGLNVGWDTDYLPEVFVVSLSPFRQIWNNFCYIIFSSLFTIVQSFDAV
jgi:hypothetical protein